MGETFEVTISDVFETLSDYQKERVYLIIGSILEGNRKVDSKCVDLDFLSNSAQKRVVLYLIEKANETIEKEK